MSSKDKLCENHPENHQLSPGLTFYQTQKIRNLSHVPEQLGTKLYFSSFKAVHTLGEILNPIRPGVLSCSPGPRGGAQTPGCQKSRLTSTS